MISLSRVFPLQNDRMDGQRPLSLFTFILLLAFFLLYIVLYIYKKVLNSGSSRAIKWGVGHHSRWE